MDLREISKSDINPETGKAYAIDPSRNIWDDNYFESVVKPKWYTTAPGQAYQAQASAKKMAEELEVKRQNAIKPAITALEAEKAPLKERYAALLDDLKRREKVQTSSAEIATAREYGKRGIPLSSGDYDMALRGVRDPISEYYVGQGRQVTADQDLSLAELARQIAGVYTTNNQQGIQDALSLYQLGQQGRESALNRGLQQDQFNLSSLLDERRLNQSASEFDRTLAENTRQFNTQEARIGSKSGSGSTTQAYKAQALQDIFGGYRHGSLIQKYGAVIDPDWITQQYNSGPVANRYGPHITY